MKPVTSSLYLLFDDTRIRMVPYTLLCMIYKFFTRSFLILETQYSTATTYCIIRCCLLTTSEPTALQHVFGKLSQLKIRKLPLSFKPQWKYSIESQYFLALVAFSTMRILTGQTTREFWARFYYLQVFSANSSLSRKCYLTIKNLLHSHKFRERWRLDQAHFENPFIITLIKKYYLTSTRIRPSGKTQNNPERQRDPVQ